MYRLTAPTKARFPFTGPQAVGEQVFAPIPQNFDEFVCSPENFDDRGDTVVVTGRFSGKNKSGAVLDAAFTHTFDFNGRQDRTVQSRERRGLGGRLVLSPG